MTNRDIFDRLVQIGMTKAGAAGCLANILAESAGRSTNVEDRSGMDDASYTQGVDSGAYRDFTVDRYGYGLCQWTLPERKAELLRFAQADGRSIGDADMQLRFMMKEMRDGYPYVWYTLTTTNDPYQAGSVMCRYYEIPDKTDKQANLRGNRAKEILAEYSGQPKNSYWPPRMICKGMSGPDVALACAILRCRGYDLPISEGFDAALDVATRKYQRSENLGADGIIGPKTWAALFGV